MTSTFVSRGASITPQPKIVNADATFKPQFGKNDTNFKMAAV
jgi:hypothetical protein